MKTTQQRVGLRSAVFVIALCSAALAQAAAGFVVSAAQQASVKVGMSRAEVRSLRGRPAHNIKFRAEPGRTWTYGVVGGKSTLVDAVFDIDFSADGRVLTMGQRIEPME
jgi:ABC-type transport system involved in cytochrome bd biosynthesis fused ATPase/permease subunit